MSDYLETNLPDLPYVLVRAPVCRPGWLIEVECWAVTAAGDGRFGSF